MNNKKTISDSKKAFHKAFPYVIPPLYRRITDELLVELHLLSHQRSFRSDSFFAVGYTTVFDAFTDGYKPFEHLGILFEALCKSTGFDAADLRSKATKSLESVKHFSTEDFQSWIKEEGQNAPEFLKKDVQFITSGDQHYSRLLTVGLLTIIKGLKIEEETNKLVDETGQILIRNCEAFGFSINRVERDISNYKSALEKLSQAQELLKETIEQERSKAKTSN